RACPDRASGSPPRSRSGRRSGAPHPRGGREIPRGRARRADSVVKLGELAPRDVADRMKGQGLDLDTGPVVARIETPITDLVDEIRSLYHDFPADAGGGLVDFHVAVRRPAGPFGVRRWLRRQAIAYLDDIRPFEPLPIHMAVPMLESSINWCAAN